MINIFKGLNKLSKDETIEEIAMIESIIEFNKSRNNFKNNSKIVALFNKISKNDKKNKKYDIRLINEMFTKKKNLLNYSSEEELKKKLENTIKSLLNIDNQASQEAISISAINEAANFMRLPNEMTPGQKADRIYEEYYGWFLGNAYEYISDKQNLNINLSKDGAKDKIKKNLKISNIAQAMLSYNFSAIAKKIDKELISQVVWISTVYNEESYAPSFESLPSYIDKSEVKDIEIEERYNKILNENDKLQKISAAYKSKLEDNNQKLNYTQKLLEKEKEKKKSAQIKLDELTKKKAEVDFRANEIADKLLLLDEKIAGKTTIDFTDEEIAEQAEYKKLREEKVKIKEEAKLLENDLVYQRRVNDRADDEIEENINTIEEINKKLIEFNSEMKKITELKDEASKHVEEEMIKRKDVITKRYKNYFKKLSFEDVFFDKIVSLNRKDLAGLELSLVELENSNDPKLLNRGWSKGHKYVLPVTFRPTVTGMIPYDVDENNNVKIEDVL